MAIVAAPVARADPKMDLFAPNPGRTKWESRPECGTMMYFGEGWSAGMQGLVESVDFVVDLLLPDLGLQAGSRIGIAPVLAWPLALPFGRPTATTVERYHCAEDVVSQMQPHRVVLEPGISFTTKTTWWLRPAYDYVWHAAGARFGFAASIGATVSLRGSDVFTSAGPEIGLRYGRCCRPLYLSFGVRYDVSLTASKEQMFLVKVGLSYR